MHLVKRSNRLNLHLAKRSKMPKSSQTLHLTKKQAKKQQVVDRKSKEQQVVEVKGRRTACFAGNGEQKLRDRGYYLILSYHGVEIAVVRSGFCCLLG